MTDVVSSPSIMCSAFCKTGITVVLCYSAKICTAFFMSGG